MKGKKVKFSNLFVRYILEECPKHKGVESAAYRANAMLADAGCDEVVINELIRTDARLAKFKLRHQEVVEYLNRSIRVALG
jgi:predicted nucleic acid-binding protein